ncbi:Nitrogen permease reactivator protein [Venturia nashicola]|uniref:Nitrogen permease reactivator protein n=1 Tax=Venturia nashicola TaxID=86259 RepID=A0A4Z1PS36_9PEZI|nr:Nitrogen permease reactivator protein [Venturia nashicola]
MTLTKLTALTTPSKYTYRIGRGEQGVLTFEPYKSQLLPLWRFRTVQIARKSSKELWERFEAYGEEGDFVGMDMARKFIQMGMTRSKRYANHAGGKKYDPSNHTELAKSTTHADHSSKLEASEIFKEVWQRCKEHEDYRRLKEEFLSEQKLWDKEQKALEKEGRVGRDEEG